MLTRRRLLTAALLSTLPLGATAAQGRLTIGLTPVIIDDRLAFLERWKSWLEETLHLPVAFVQRQRYREITDLLLAGALDAAWICGYPYVQHRQRLRLLAVPSYQGGPWYRSYVIVTADAPQTRLAELRGGVFAFSDPDSNSGYLYPLHRLHQLGISPADDLRRTFFTWSHRNTIEAVASGLADGGAVDGYVWDTFAGMHPEITGQTRIVERSPRFGFPPLVTAVAHPFPAQAGLQQALLQMDRDPRGQELLRALGLDGFREGVPALYDGIAQMMRAEGLPPAPPADGVRAS